MIKQISNIKYGYRCNAAACTSMPRAEHGLSYIPRVSVRSVLRFLAASKKSHIASIIHFQSSFVMHAPYLIRVYGLHRSRSSVCAIFFRMVSFLRLESFADVNMCWSVHLGPFAGSVRYLADRVVACPPVSVDSEAIPLYLP